MIDKPKRYRLHQLADCSTHELQLELARAIADMMSNKISRSDVVTGEVKQLPQAFVPCAMSDDFVAHYKQSYVVRIQRVLHRRSELTQAGNKEPRTSSFSTGARP